MVEECDCFTTLMKIQNIQINLIQYMLPNKAE